MLTVMGIVPKAPSIKSEKVLAISEKCCIMNHMKNVVYRYHSSPVSFDSRIEAEDFAMNCGDFKDLVEVACAHSWSVAQSSAHAEMLVCYDCGKTRKIYVD